MRWRISPYNFRIERKIYIMTTRAECIRALEKHKGNRTKAAKELGIPRSTLRNKVGEVAEKSAPEIITVTEEHSLRRENTRLRKQIRELTEISEKAGDIEAIVNKLTEREIEPPKWITRSGNSKKIERAIVTATLSDTHFDEVVNPAEINYVNAYNREIATLRLAKFFTNVEKLSKNYINGIQVDGLVMPMLGDMVSGYIHEELRETNEAGIIDTVLYYSNHICTGLEQMLEVFDKVFVPCVVGNHGRLDKKVRSKGRPTESFDYLMYHMIARHFANVDGITFGISADADYRYTIYKSRYHLTHGDQFRGGSGISGMLSPILLGDHRKRKREAATGSPYDYLVHGHWHQLAYFRNIISNGALKGYDEYAATNNFDFEQPQQAFWLTDPQWGKTINAPVHVLSSREGWQKQETNKIEF